METYNYSQFTFNDKNREISNKNVSDLKKSILEIGFIKQRAILVNENYLIIDGHHRFLALQGLKLPIHYEIEKKVSLKEMILLNSCQKGWALSDFVKLYAKQGILEYKELVRISETYKVTMSNTIAIVFSLTSSGSSSKIIKSGGNFEMYHKKDELLKLILLVQNNLGFTIKNNLVYSLKILLDRTNHKQITKVIDSLSSIREQTSVINYLVTFENIINRKVSDANKINLLKK